jgi:hypothetical protein
MLGSLHDITMVSEFMVRQKILPSSYKRSLFLYDYLSHEFRSQRVPPTTCMWDTTNISCEGYIYFSHSLCVKYDFQIMHVILK